MELVNICKECGVPDGVVNLLSGDPAKFRTIIDLILLKKFLLQAQQELEN